jgi:hypothetical protein
VAATAALGTTAALGAAAAPFLGVAVAIAAAAATVGAAAAFVPRTVGKSRVSLFLSQIFPCYFMNII